MTIEELQEYMPRALAKFDNLQPILQPDLQPQLEDIAERVKRLIFSTDVYMLNGKEMLERYISCNHLATHLATGPTTLTRQAFSKSILKPAVESGYIKMLYPDKPTSRNQKYQLTEKGMQILKALHEMEEPTE